jgi:hypothetical protein
MHSCGKNCTEALMQTDINPFGPGKGEALIEKTQESNF